MVTTSAINTMRTKTALQAGTMTSARFQPGSTSLSNGSTKNPALAAEGEERTNNHKGKQVAHRATMSPYVTRPSPALQEAV